MLVGGLYALPFNLLNLMPIINVPAGICSDDMPIGMQIVARPKNSETVLQIAYNYSKRVARFFQGALMPKYVNTGKFKVIIQRIQAWHYIN